MHREGHVVAEDEVAGLRVGEANLSQIPGDQGPDIGARHEHRRICTLGRQGHDEHALHGRSPSVGVGGLDHEAKVGEPGFCHVVVQRELDRLQHGGIHEPWCIRRKSQEGVVARGKLCQIFRRVLCTWPPLLRLRQNGVGWCGGVVQRARYDGSNGECAAAALLPLCENAVLL